VTTAPVRVLLADDHTLVRAGVRRILEGDSRFVVIGEAANGGQALEAVRRAPADVLILDLSMPGKDGFEVLAEARTTRPELKILVLSMHANSEVVARAVREGADGYLLKDSAVQELVSAIEAVTSGRPYFAPAVQRTMSGLLGAPSAVSPLALLTEREREVLRLVAEGLSSKEIGARLDISVRTVETHRSNLMRKLELNSVARLTQFAIRAGLLGSP
jgi:DNA-binding NarL/FixJ family response regulator